MTNIVPFGFTLAELVLVMAISSLVAVFVLAANGQLAKWERLDEAGDTLIEVVFALAILTFVLVGSTLLAIDSFRLGQTARERTTVADGAQQQMEALRSFRDNHTWDEFENGSNCGGPGGYCGINSPATAGTGCHYASPCFHMVDQPTAFAAEEWVPAPGPVAATVPTSEVEINTATPVGARACGFDFTVRYSFIPLGGTAALPDTNEIQTRLVNLTYAPPSAPAPAVCP